MAGAKGRSGGKRPGSGRKPGTPNLVPAQLKDMILQALHNQGGVQYLETQAATNPNAFMGLIGRVLPMTVTGDKENPVETVVRIQWGE
jgi:hypothetical protein